MTTKSSSLVAILAIRQSSFMKRSVQSNEFARAYAQVNIITKALQKKIILSKSCVCRRARSILASVGIIGIVNKAPSALYKLFGTYFICALNIRTHKIKGKQVTNDPILTLSSLEKDVPFKTVFHVINIRWKETPTRFSLNNLRIS